MKRWRLLVATALLFWLQTPVLRSGRRIGKQYAQGWFVSAGVPIEQRKGPISAASFLLGFVDAEGKIVTLGPLPNDSVINLRGPEIKRGERFSFDPVTLGSFTFHLKPVDLTRRQGDGIVEGEWFIPPPPGVNPLAN